MNNVINISKFLLILGVILIHTNLTPVLPENLVDSAGGNVISYITDMMQACVPAFFIISGYLFFSNINHWNITVYKSKLKKRVHTLLVPYILWNLISVSIQFYKAHNPIYEDFGLIESGNLNWFVFFKGFWNIGNGFPWAMAFWFIRNLIVITLLTPVIYYISKNKFLTIISIICFSYPNQFFFLNGLAWFILGAFISNNGYRLKEYKSTFLFIVSLFLWIICSYIVFFKISFATLIFLIIKNISCFTTIWIAASYIRNSKCYINNKKVLNSTFFLYASHQLYITLIKRIIINHSNIYNPLILFTDYISTFISLTVLSYIIYLIFSHYLPKTTAILTGNRS